MSRPWITYLDNKKVLVGIFLFLFIFLLIVFWQLEKKVTSQTLDRLGDQLSMMLNDQLEQERSNALQYALVLSRNSGLIDALYQEDEDKGFEILSEVMESIKLYTDVLIRTQVITADYVIFARSWDNSYAGMPLEFHRPDLLYFQNHKKPRAAIEVGRKLGVKATVPIYLQNDLIGFVEAVTFFETTQEYFEQLGIKMYILMDDRFFETAVFMQENPEVGKEYILVNSKYTNSDVTFLDRINFASLRNQRTMYSQGRYLFYEPMKNGEGETIGAFVFTMTPKQVEMYARSDEDSLSMLLHLSRKELYDQVIKKNTKNPLVENTYDKELIYLKDTVAAEDRELFMEEAKERLRTYSKEELIGIILGYDVKKELKGEIR